MKRILFENKAGDNQIQLARAIDKAIEIFKENNEVQSVIFLIPTKNNTAPLELFFGDQYKQIGKGLRLVKDGPGIRVLSEKTLKNAGHANTIVISVYCDVEGVKIANELANCSALIAIPWLEDELNEWTNTWEVEIYDKNGNLKSASQVVTINNPIVLNAVNEFPSSGNISHPSDKSSVASKFKILNKNGITYNTDEIAAYLVREKKWSQKDAAEVKVLGDDIIQGKSVRSGDLTNDAEAIARWSN